MKNWLILVFMPLLLVLNNCFQQLAGTDNGSETSNGITGMVVDSTNKPLSGVDVWLRSHNFFPGKENMLQKKTRSDTDGVFQFTDLAPAQYVLEIKQGFSSAKVEFFSYEGERIEMGSLMMASTGAITGQVLDKDCQDGGCTVYLQGLNETISVDSGGRFTALGIPAGKYNVVLVTPDNLLEQKGIIPVKPGSSTDITISGPENISEHVYREYEQNPAGMLKAFLVNQFGKNFTGLDSIIGQSGKSVTKLDLSGLGMDSLHPSIGYCQSLDTLILNHNPVTILPPEIGELHALKVLRTKNCSLSTLPPEMAKLVELQILDFTQNLIPEIPDEVYTLKNLRVLNIQENPISQISDSLGLLTKLSSIGMAGCEIKTFPPSIGNLSSLTQIWAANNSIEFLPESIGKLYNLETIQLDGNNLLILPESFGNLTKLKNLYISNNQITRLPQSITNIQSIERMFVKRNNICNPSEEVKQWLDQNAETNWSARQSGC